MRKSKRAFKVIIIAVVLAALVTLLILTAIFSKSYALTSFLFIVLSLIPFFVSFERKRPAPRELVPIAVLSAIAALGRVIFAPFPNIKPTSAIVIITGIVFGPQAGFITGAAAALTSNFFFGQGPFTPWQMFAWGIMGFAAGFWGKHVPCAKGKTASNLMICSLGFISCFFYGWIMDLWQLLGFVSSITPVSAILTFAASFYFDLIHAVSTVVFLLALALPWIRILNRIRFKYGLLVSPADLSDPQEPKTNP